MTWQPRHLAIGALLFGLGIATLAAACSATGPIRDFPTGSGGLGGQGGQGGEPDLGFGGQPDGGVSGGITVDPTTCEEAEKKHSYVGCDFWPTPLDNIVDAVFDYAVVAANVGQDYADVTITREGVTVAKAHIAPNDLATMVLPWVEGLRNVPPDSCGNSDPLLATARVDGGAYHVVSTRPISVYQFNPLEYQSLGGPPGKNWGGCASCVNGECNSYTNDASLLLPSTALTGDYRITGQAGDDVMFPPYFAVTGTAPDTKVTVKLAKNAHIAAGGGLPETFAGETATFTIGAGDVVEVIGTISSDFSGSLVLASKPVQVLTGVACINSPLDAYACDHLEEVVFPAETLGKHYVVTVPTSPDTTPVGHVVRIYGNVDDTTLTYPTIKPVGGPTTISAGEVKDLGVVTESFEILGDHEFAVGSFQLGAALLGKDPLQASDEGDPAQSMATAVEQYRTKYVFLAPLDYDFSFVDVVLPKGTKLTLDGKEIFIKFEPIGPIYGVSRVLLNVGNGGAHSLSASAPVGIQVIGYGAYTSYQYPGGLDLNAIAPPPAK
jgi:hypothetical protein